MIFFGQQGAQEAIHLRNTRLYSTGIGPDASNVRNVNRETVDDVVAQFGDGFESLDGSGAARREKFALKTFL